MTLAHRVVVMNGGVIEQVGAPAEVYRAPATEFVARFIGSPEMNVFSAEVARRVLGGSVAGDERVGVRPEDVQPAVAVSDDAAALHFGALIEVVELTGSQAIVTLVAAGDERLHALVSARSAGHLREGATASFAVDREALLRFDAQGRRVVP